MPQWDRKKNIHRMDFGGRVTQASVKNMKLEKVEPRLAAQAGKKSSVKLPSCIFMCGRTDAKDVFTCDFMAPLTPLEAFCIAVANLIHKPIYQWM